MASLPEIVPVGQESPEPAAIRGFLHRPGSPSGDALALTHGAGSDCAAPLLVALARAFAERGIAVLRFELPFRQQRPHGPPSPDMAARDREGIGLALAWLRQHASGRIFAGGHSYGGRQTSMLLAGDPGLADAMLLLSYPLHPPRQPARQRTDHFPRLVTPALFIHGSRDPFGREEEVRSAAALIPARTSLVLVEGAGHDLDFGRRRRETAGDVPALVVRAFQEFVAL